MREFIVNANNANSTVASVVRSAASIRAVVPSEGEKLLSISVPPTLNKCGVLLVLSAPNLLFARSGCVRIHPTFH
ncbi:MAG: hypothetical protein IPI91_10950 [Flavobacteriales bacterium]|nr:hypothetical protein [Flavobacteriales bacterium]